jgi:photosystem II stability/assembly factor-like uncharacterized protein
MRGLGGVRFAIGAVTVVFLAAAVSAAVVPEPKEPPDLMAGLKFRAIGPTVAGGRVSAITGVPGNPDTLYVGAAAGGVFKTTNGGNSWTAVFDKQPVASIGAIALAPSNPNVVWVGTGEANIRNDVMAGRGVYVSPDGGATWRFTGLKDAGQISRIVVDPTNPERAFVAVVGHAWGPNPERGVFRTSDGGASWEKVLYVSDTTGCADLIMEPGNPQVLLAAMWQVVRYPWTLEDGGPGSGIYRSTDGGTTWSELHEGLPEKPYGRIALAAAPSHPEHVWALVEAKKGMLWDSEDLGSHWRSVSDNHLLDVRPFYFSHFVVAPNDEHKLFFCSMQLVESDDGGRTAHVIARGVHVDHHALWIDPQHPKVMVNGNDGGVWSSHDGGKTWSFLDNLPIEQFYQVAVDDKVPYDIAGGLQDNSGWMGPSRNPHGRVMDGTGWFTVTGGDGEYAVPAPSDPSIVYADLQGGWVTRLDLKTGLGHSVRPTVEGGFSPSKPQSELTYRYNWTSPLAVSATDANEVYLGANVLFKTTDGGTTWRAISPDLTRNDKSKQQLPGGPVNLDLSGAENYDTILSIGLSRPDPKVIWVGTDDGLIQVTRDGGASWSEVGRNIAGLKPWGRIYQIDPSPFDAAACVVSVDRHMLDDDRPYVFRTTDYGRTWKPISAGLPADSPVFVVREDPNTRGLLVAGTDRGLFISTDDGASWRSLASNFPPAPVFDLTFQKQRHDLVVATHGRGMFVLDDITPLERLTSEIEKAELHVFQPQAAEFFQVWRNSENNRASRYDGPNPPDGAVITYWLKQEIKPAAEKHGDGHGEAAPGAEKPAAKEPVTVTITDAAGKEINTLHGPGKAGMNRVAWNLRYGPATKLSREITKAPEQEAGEESWRPSGPLVVPGTYTVTVKAGDRSEKTTVTVAPDPRFPFDQAAAEAQLKAALDVRADTSALNVMLNRIQQLRDQLAATRKAVTASDENGAGHGTPAAYTDVLAEAKALDTKLADMMEKVYNTKVQGGVGEDDIHYLSRLHDVVSGQMMLVAMGYDTAPRPVVNEQLAATHAEVVKALDAFAVLLKSDVPAYNTAATAKGLPVLFVAEGSTPAAE